MIDSTLLINKQLECAKVMCGTSDYTDALLGILITVLSNGHTR